jgi:nitric oxide synthase oxygenase domain/subunit
MTLVKADPYTGPDGPYCYAVEVRSHGAPVTGSVSVRIGGLRVRSIEFEVPVDGDKMRQGTLSELIDQQRYDAGVRGAEAVAAGTDWPAGKYLVTVRGRHSASTYVADIDKHRSYSLLLLEK